MKVGSQVQATKTKFIINGQRKIGPVEGQVITMTSRKVVIEGTKEQMFQITPANFLANFQQVSQQEQIAEVEVVEEQVIEAEVEQIVEAEVEVPQQEIAQKPITRKQQIKKLMDEGETSPTKIAKAIGMNVSYCMRLVSQLRKEA